MVSLARDEVELMHTICNAVLARNHDEELGNRLRNLRATLAGMIDTDWTVFEMVEPGPLMDFIAYTDRQKGR